MLQCLPETPAPCQMEFQGKEELQAFKNWRLLKHEHNRAQVLSYYLKLFEKSVIDLVRFKSSFEVQRMATLREFARKANGGVILQSAKHLHAIKITATGGKMCFAVDVMGESSEAPPYDNIFNRGRNGLFFSSYSQTTQNTIKIKNCPIKHWGIERAISKIACIITALKCYNGNFDQSRTHKTVTHRPEIIQVLPKFCLIPLKRILMAGRGTLTHSTSCELHVQWQMGLHTSLLWCWGFQRCVSLIVSYMHEWMSGFFTV